MAWPARGMGTAADLKLLVGTCWRQVMMCGLRHLGNRCPIWDHFFQGGSLKSLGSDWSINLGWSGLWKPFGRTSADMEYNLM